MKKNSMILNVDKNVSYIDDVNDDNNDSIFKANTTNNSVKMELYEFENIENKNRIVDNDRSFIEGLINLISVERADDYNEWINMGYNIHSLSRTEFGYKLPFPSYQNGLLDFINNLMEGDNLEKWIKSSIESFEHNYEVFYHSIKDDTLPYIQFFKKILK